jgi:hypothetical protein
MFRGKRAASVIKSGTTRDPPNWLTASRGTAMPFRRGRVAADGGLDCYFKARAGATSQAVPALYSGSIIGTVGFRCAREAGAEGAAFPA